jgi:hypothetical protein
MVRLYIHFDDLTAQAAGKHMDAVVHFLRNRTAQHSISKFRDPNNVILTVHIVHAITFEICSSVTPFNLNCGDNSSLGVADGHPKGKANER